MSDEYDDYQEGSDEEETYENLDEDRQEEDLSILKEDIDDSAKKQIDNTEKDETQKEDDEDEEEEINIYDLKTKKSKLNTKQVIMFEYERIPCISTLATLIDDSRVFVPEEFEHLLECNSGDSIRIARNWFNNRDKIKLPFMLFRRQYGLENQLVDTILRTKKEIEFHDLEDDGKDIEYFNFH